MSNVKNFASVTGNVGENGFTSRLTKKGDMYVTGSLAVNNRETGHTAWFGIKAFGKVAKALVNSKQGDLLRIEGDLEIGLQPVGVNAGATQLKLQAQKFDVLYKAVAKELATV
jgi:Single-strand binding protein family